MTISSEEKSNITEAEVLIEYAKKERNNVGAILPMLDAILANKEYDKWDWEILKLIEGRTSYLYFEIDTDVDVEYGDWGMPIMTGADNPIGVEAQDINNLAILRKTVSGTLFTAKIII